MQGIEGSRRVVCLVGLWLAAAGCRPPELDIASAELPPAILDLPYAHGVEAIGGNGGLRWSLEGVPPELTWLAIDDRSGRLTSRHVPRAPAPEGVAFTVRVEDTAGHAAARAFQLSVLECVGEGLVACLVASDEEAPRCAAGVKQCTGGRGGPCVAAAPLQPSTSPEACGAGCGACAEGSECRDGQCACGDEGACAPTETCCGGRCIDLANDARNCGVCGAACEVNDASNAVAVCVEGECRLACASPFTRCEGSASCTDLRDDEDNCGACGQTCTVPDGLTGVVGPLCERGACGLRCSTDRENCDSIVGNGCETHLASDEASCGACGNACPVPSAGTHATARCHQGACGIQCDQDGGDWASCGRPPEQGCPVNLDGDIQNCGACGNTCPLTGTQVTGGSCVEGQCRVACTASFANCDGDASNGCETVLVSNANCGACGRVCPARTFCNGTLCVPLGF